jgi:TonB family protein
MRVRRFAVMFLFISLGVGPARTAQGQSSAPEGRHVVRKMMPVYPEIAKRMNLSGTVKVQATVSPDGSVKSVQPVGGSPVLIQAAQDAVYKWKFAAATAESKELIELRFDPQQQ